MSGVRWDGDLGAFVVSGYDEAAAVLRGEGWSSDLRLSPLINEELKALPTAGNLLTTDPPEHTRLRRVVSPVFTPRSIESIRSDVAAIVSAVVDGLHEIGPEIDVLGDVGYPVTLAVIAEMLDVGTEGAALFAEHTPALARGFDFDAGVDELTAAVLASTELSLFLTPILAKRRREPGEDLMSRLLVLSEGDEPALSLGEVFSTCALLLVAGHETTANLIGNSLLALLQDVSARASFASSPERMVEELLRVHGPLKATLRTAVVDQDLAGMQIPAGRAVLVDVQTADRDPQRFPDPLRLAPDREHGHLAFGAGPHFCLGAALARLEAVEVLTTFVRRFPTARLADAEIRWRESRTLHALHELRVQL